MKKSINKFINYIFKLTKQKIIFITILAENLIRTLIVLFILNLFSNHELSSLGILQATIALFTITLPLGFGISSQRFSIDIESKEFLSANTLYYLICFVQIAIIYLIWDITIHKIEGLNFSKHYYKLIFLAICFLKVELAKVKSILRILSKKLLFVLLSLVPILVEFILIFIYLDSSSSVFDLFTIRVISMIPVLLFTIYLFRYFSINFISKKVIKYSLITIPNKLVTGSLGYLMNLFAFNLGTDYMAKFYSSSKIANILNIILNAYYQYVEPSFYRNKGIILKQNKELIKNTLMMSVIFILMVFGLKIFFSDLEISNNISVKIIALLSSVYILTLIFRFVSFKLFYNLRNDLIFYINCITVSVFASISHFVPEYFLEALIIGLSFKVLLTKFLDNIYFRINEQTTKRN